ncbi:mitochondrial import inner membrane translocase subunit Tim23B-like [Styela clava]|uniref:mitochondrial import inner membrane translocase subunit Tim23B-like n=1 Tax=Styela clava TaxID=7725 RepID=UPI0019395E71|nr:mitochondrial import inner membrane translocase subunit Tim23B-like [Styela clava]
MNLSFGSGEESSEDKIDISSSVMTPYLNINPHYLDTADQYILPEDAAPMRSRAQMMFSTIGGATVIGAGVGGMESLRYSGLQWLKGKSARMQFTSAILKNGGKMAQKFGSIAVLYCACSIICEKSRGVEDEFNTLIGGAAAGGLYMIPSAINAKTEIAVAEEAKKKLSVFRRLPPIGRILFGAVVGVGVGGMLCLYKMKAPDYIREMTKRK